MDGLEEAGWYIFNGCGKGDEEGEWTYAGGRGESVLDYVIGDEEVWGRVERVRVENRIVGSLPGSGMDQRGRRGQ